MTLEGSSRRLTMVDVLDRVLDKGIVIDAWAGVSVAGIELITIRARVVVTSIETRLSYREASLVAQPAIAGGPEKAVATGTIESLTATPCQISEAEPLLGAEYVIRHSLLAGERAIISNSYDDALGHFERAEAAAAVSPEPVDDAIMAAVLAGQARSLTSMSLDRPSE